MAQKNPQNINKKFHAICEEFTTSSASSLNKKEQPVPLAQENITIIIEYAPEKTFNLSFTANDLKLYTCGKLFIDSLSKLLTILEEDAPKAEIHIESIVSLQTKKRELIKDYFLTLPERKVDFLEHGTVLTFYHKTFVVDIGESPIEARISFNDFEILAKLGEGGFATVYLARWKKNGLFYALKQIEKGLLTQDDRQALLRERNAMFELKLPFLATLHTAFQTAKYCYFVLDFLAGGDLLHALSKTGRFSENSAKHIVAELLIAMRQVHDRNYIYRDLKIENVLLDCDGHVHLCDFGLAKKVEKIKDLNYSLCGTPEFLAPEVYLETGYNYMADIYSVAPLLYELVTGTLAFEAESTSALKLKILKAKPAIPDYLTQELRNLLERLFEKDPSKRIGAKTGVKEVMMHPWFKGIDWTALENKKLKMPFMLDVGKKTFKAIPIDLNIEKDKLTFLNKLPAEEEKGEKEKTRVACFSYYSPLQKAKLKQRKQNNEVRAAKKNIQKRIEEEGSKKKAGNTPKNAWIGDFDRTDTDQGLSGTLSTKHIPYSSILNSKFKQMSQAKLKK